MAVKWARPFFFWDGILHKVIRKDRPGNLVDAYRFSDGQVVTFLYSDWLRNAGKAITHKEAAEMIRLKPDTLNQYIQDGHIPEPQRSWSIGSNPGAVKKTGKHWMRWWSEKDMLRLHEYVTSKHRGAPRLDGKITPMQHLPSRAEIVSAFNESQTVFIRMADGTEIPLFKPPKV